MKTETQDYAPSERKEGEINMDLNEHPYPTPSILEGHNLHLNQYTPISSKTREAIADKFQVDVDSIFITHGCNHGLEMVSQVILNEMDLVIIMAPYFPLTKRHIEQRTLNVEIIPPRKNNDYDWKALRSYQANPPRAIFFANPCNPTGYWTRKSTIEKYVKLFPDTMFVIDEALMFHDNREAFELLEKYSNIIILRSFSKNFGLAALRIGFGCTREENAHQITEQISPFIANEVAQIAVQQIMHHDIYLDMYVNNIRRELKIIKKELRKLGLRYSNTKASNFLIDFRNWRMFGSIITKILSKEYKIHVTAAHGHFKVHNEAYSIRVVVSTPDNNRTFLKALADIKKRRDNGEFGELDQEITPVLMLPNSREIIEDNTKITIEVDEIETDDIDVDKPDLHKN